MEKLEKEELVVSNTSKLLKWKQITTLHNWANATQCCFQYVKVTKMKANHNSVKWGQYSVKVVSNTSKLLKWKQITTNPIQGAECRCCFQYVKVTKMKANHNNYVFHNVFYLVVSNTSKLLKWKQITTENPSAILT